MAPVRTMLWWSGIFSYKHEKQLQGIQGVERLSTCQSQSLKVKRPPQKSGTAFYVLQILNETLQQSLTTQANTATAVNFKDFHLNLLAFRHYIGHLANPFIGKL